MKNNNVFYSCPYCKEEYTQPGDLARCILSCEEKKRIEEEQAKKAKLEAEKQKRYDAIVVAYDKFEEDYGAFTLKSEKNGCITHLWDFLKYS